MSRLHARAFRSPGFWVICSAVVIAFAANVNSDGRDKEESNSPGSQSIPRGKLIGVAIQSTDQSGSKTDGMLREDTKLTSVRGQFSFNNGRYEFLEEGASKPLKCLENLWLHRIVEAQKSSTRKSIWTVSLTIKEFANENFALIETASRAH